MNPLPSLTIQLALVHRIPESHSFLRINHTCACFCIHCFFQYQNFSHMKKDDIFANFQSQTCHPFHILFSTIVLIYTLEASLWIVLYSIFWKCLYFPSLSSNSQKRLRLPYSFRLLQGKENWHSYWRNGLNNNYYNTSVWLEKYFFQKRSL